MKIELRKEITAFSIFWGGYTLIYFIVAAFDDKVFTWRGYFLAGLFVFLVVIIIPSLFETRFIRGVIRREKIRRRNRKLNK